MREHTSNYGAKLAVENGQEVKDKNESVSKEALVIPSNTGLPVAGLFPSRISPLFTSVNSLKCVNIHQIMVRN